MNEFDYAAPSDLREALDLIGAHPGSASLLAGGTDLVVAMRAGKKKPTLVIDVKKIQELTSLSIDSARVTLGAAVSCRRLYQHPAISPTLFALAESARVVGGIQIQSRATIGGNLCNAAPSGDTVPSLIVHGAKAYLSSAAGSRSVAVEEVCTGPGKTCLLEGEMLTHLSLPIPPKNSGAMFLRFTPRMEMDIAVANAAVQVQLDSAGKSFIGLRIAIGAVAPVPLLVNDAAERLVGELVNEKSIAEAARICAAAARPITDMRGTAEHRRQLVSVLVARAIGGAVSRARGTP